MTAEKELMEMMMRGICIIGNIVKKMSTPVDDRTYITQSPSDINEMKFENGEAALEYARKYLGGFAIECSVILGFKPKGARLELVRLTNVTAKSPEEAQELGEALAVAWLKSRPDIWDLVKTQTDQKNYDVKVRPL